MRLPVALLCASAPVVALVMTTQPALSQPSPATASAPAAASAPKRPEGLPLVFKSGAGEPRGTGTLTAGPRGVLVRLELTGLTPGWHALHFHAVADCSDPALQKAGAHVQHPMGKVPHGFLNPGGPDAGDLPNVWADARGEAHAEVWSTAVSTAPDKARANLLDADGSSLIVHAAADDAFTQPIGGAGARVACALIAQP